MLVDFAKAFDSVSWKFMYSVLKFFGFGSNIIRWIQTFNPNIKATILQSIILSEFINIEKGCQQGDPIVAYLFIICAEILWLMIVTYIGHYISTLYITYIRHYISALFNLSFMFIHCHKR